MVSPEQTPAETTRRIPWQQVLFDDIFLLLMIGLVVPTFFYIIWGLMSLAEVPIFAP
jgi:hypothetical protein